MMVAQKNRGHVETAMNAGSAAPYLRPICGRTLIEQLRSSPSLDSSPPDS
jgi:hypothetical protein